MKVQFVALTHGTVKVPIKEEHGSEERRAIIEQLNAEEMIAYAARVSNPANQLNTGTTEKLLGYLIRNRHWSPFEMASMTVEITTSRGIAPQILRHRSFSFQEFSLRYAEAVDFEVYEARRQDTKNRQNSVDDMSEDDRNWFRKAQEANNDYAYNLYRCAIDRGIAKEQARFLLPLTTQTKLYMCGTVRSWIHYIQVRDETGVQKEHRDIAIEVKKIFIENFPSTAKALEWK